MPRGCGLVMKEDITQHKVTKLLCLVGCGLVMKEDITQQKWNHRSCLCSCGLVMKEDITQQTTGNADFREVVVW